jgi:GNAT superfamily N-acetyltransferase
MNLAIARTDDDAVLAAHYRRHWLELGIAAAEMAPDWQARFHAFVRAARAERGFAAFLARHEDVTYGSACCHMVDRPYPAFRTEDCEPTGYVWGVYVDPAARGHGVGRQLVRACVAHLERQGCGRVLLHTGARARPLYERLGFAPTDELALRLGAAQVERDSVTVPSA